MSSPGITRLWDVVRQGLASALALSFALGVLCGGSCHVHACYGDPCCGDGCCHDGPCDPDDRDRDDPRPPPAPEWDGGSRLEGFSLVGATVPGSHPVAAIVPAHGPAIRRPVADLTGPDPAATALDFTGGVLRANPAFFDLPEWAGELAPTSVRPTAEGGLRVLWSQVRGAVGSTGGHGVVFHLDARGGITRIENGTRILF